MIAQKVEGESDRSERMCKAMEEMRNETVLAERRKIAQTLILMGELSYEKIAEGTKLTIEEVKALGQNQSEGNM